jgi:hypothetical protein
VEVPGGPVRHHYHHHARGRGRRWR